ncbi:MAG: hypothetical protein V9G14_16505 [Cypionkella sp.]|nr:hypothetical protein [Cypionkella sp.]
MPLPHFLLLIATVIVVAGASIALTVALNIPVIWLMLGALIGATVVRGLSWR